MVATSMIGSKKDQLTQRNEFTMDGKLTSYAKQLRKNATDAERVLWQAVRSRQVLNCKFRRQVVFGRYIVDFVCLDAKLIIELDGGQHAEQVLYDEHRTVYLESLGYQVIRFWNNDVLQQLDVVLEKVRLVLIAGLECPHPSPLPGGEGNR